jgi:hypothetical protein
MTFPTAKCNQELPSSAETANCGGNGQDVSRLPPYGIAA